MSTFIYLRDVGLDFPVFGNKAKSFKNTIAASVTGGRIGKDAGVSVIQSLRNINLELRAGDRLGIMGHNGAGKSTLLRLLAGVYEPTVGEYRREGSVASLIDPNMGIEPDATGVENIVLRCLMMGYTRKQIDTFTSEIIDFSGLGEYMYMPVRTYSTGMLMRLSFSISTCIKADILLMDEWLSVGDAEFRSKAEVKMREVLKATGILILASHSPELLLNECNKFVNLEHGRIVSYDAPTF